MAAGAVYRRNMAFEHPLYPVGLVLSGRPVLVVGGGRIAARKVPALLDCGARVTIVAPQIAGELAARPLRLEHRPYRRGEVAGYALAIAATGRSEVDRAVHADGEAAGVLVNAADDPAACSVVLPAVLRRGRICVAVSTGGASPALAAFVRDRIDAALPPEMEAVGDLVAEVRRRVRSDRSSEGLPWASLIADLAELLAAGRAAEAAELAATFPQPADEDGHARRCSFGP